MPSKNLKKITQAIGGCVFTVGMMVLVGWLFDIGAFKSIFPGLVTMKANTAMGMCLCGGALALLARERTGKSTGRLAAMAAVAVLTLGALTLGEYLLGCNFGIDQLLFRDGAGAPGTSQPGRMSPATAFCFLLIGGSLLVASRPSIMRLRLPLLTALAASVVVVGGLALTGYITDSLFNLRWWNYTGMAIHSAAGFLLLGCGLLAFAKTEGGLSWSLDRLTTAGFAVGIASLLATAGLSYHFTNQLQQSAAWVSHTQEVLKEIEEISADVATLGSSERNYINTGNEHLLEQKKQITDAIHEDLDAVRKLTGDNFHQKPRLDRLEPLIARRIDWGEQSVADRRQQGVSAAEQLIAAGQGIALSDSIRSVIEEMKDEEYSLLAERQKKEQAVSTTTFLLLPLGVFLSLTMLSLGLFFLNAGVGDRAKVEKKSDWLASFPEHNPNPIVELDLEDGVLHYVNPAARQLFPNLPSEGPRHPLLAGLTEVQRTLLAGKTDTARREIAADEFFFSQTITYIPEAQRLRVYSTDITERRAAETDSLRLAAIVKSSDDAIISKDLDGIITSWNKSAEKIFGHAAGEMVGTSIMRLIPADRYEEEQQILAKIKRGENVEHFETRRQTKDGRLIDVSVTASPVKDSGGTIIGVSKVARDITESKRAEAALRESEERFRVMANSITQLAWIAHADGFIFWYNQQWFDYTGTTPAQMEGWGWQSVHDPEILPKVMAGWQAAIKAGKAFEMEFPLRGADGKFRAFLTRAQPVKSPEGRVVQWCGTNTDVEDLKRVEEKIQQLNTELEQRVIERTAQLEAANKELEAFSYSVSHDLRAPLRGVDGYIQMLQEDCAGQLDAEGNRLLGVVSSEAKRMGRLIDDLLTFSRLGRAHMAKAEIDTTALARSVFENLTETGPVPRFELKPLPPTQGDLGMLRQVFVNLLSNAIKFTRHQPAPLIEVGSRNGEAVTVYFVKDNGVGFDEKYGHKLFGVFQRLHSEDEFEGTGVGLALVQRVIQRHGGKVWAEAKPNQGATFYFTLPITADNKGFRT